MTTEIEQHLDRALKLVAQTARMEEERRWQEWRKALLRCWANGYNATMTAMLEGGPSEQAQK